MAGFCDGELWIFTCWVKRSGEPFVATWNTKMKKNRTRRILPVGFLVVLSLAGCFCSGCANEMIQHGWAIHSQPITEKPRQGEHHWWYRDGAQPPTARKDQNGDLQVDYDVMIDRWGALGSWHPEREPLRFERRTRLVMRTELEPAGRYDSLRYFMPTNGMIRLPPNSVVSFIGVKDGPFRYPQEECVFLLEGGWYWYVPPSSPSDVPQLALIVGKENYTPWHIWPVRLVCYPFFLVGDLIIWPPYYIAVGLGLAEGL